MRTAIKSRATAFTALLATADKLASVIPDANTRLKAAYATVAGEGRDVPSILQAIEVHAADLESQRMQFSKQAEDAMKATVGSKRAELETIDPSIASAQQQVQSLQQQIQALNEAIAQKNIRKGELTADIATEEQRFNAAKQQFETALTIVRAELDSQKAVIVEMRMCGSMTNAKSGLRNLTKPGLYQQLMYLLFHTSSSTDKNMDCKWRALKQQQIHFVNKV